MTQALTEDHSSRISDQKSHDVLSLYNECHEFAFRNWSGFIDEASKDLAMYLGDQWNPQDRAFLRSQKRNALTFNKVRRIIKMVTGFERKSRHSLIAQPVENSDEITANQLTEILLWQMNNQNMGHTMSDVFEGAIKTGINLAELSMNYSDDPVNGDINLTRIPYNAFLLDPRFSKRDLSDCEYILQRRKLSREACMALLPFAREEIRDLHASGEDEKFPYMQNYSDTRRKTVLRYDEFWLRKFKDVKVLVDRETGETKQLNEKEIDRDRLNQFLAVFPNIQVINKSVPTVELNILVEEKVMFSVDDPLGVGDFPHVPVMAFWDPEFSGQSGQGDFSLKLQSLSRCMRDAQQEINKRRSKMLDIIDSQVNSGWQVKANAVVNPKDLYQSGQGKVIWMQDGAQMQDAQRLPAPDIPNGLFNLSQMFDQDLQAIAGATDELLGQPDNGSQISGETVKMRQGAALTILQDVFDNFRLSQKLLGQKLIKMVQNNYTPDKVQRITNQEPSQEFYNGSFGKYDVTVEESVETPTQRALVYQQLLQARQIGVNVPDSIILDYMPIQGKDKLMEAIQQQEQQQQAQKEKLEKQEMMALELANSQKEENLALAQERRARVISDISLAAERSSEAQENMASAALSRAKTITEIASLETDQVLKVLEFVNSLEKQEVAGRDEVTRQNLAIANAINSGTEGSPENKQVLQEQQI
jgi:hypothetical protein